MGDPDILTIIFSRRSIRKYLDRPVEKDLLVSLLKGAMAAPSARNGQPWEFVVITDPSRMQEIRSKMKYGNYNAPAAICVCSNLEIARSRSSKNFWVQDCTAALENILITAAGLGLGTVWLGVYPKIKTVRNVRQILGIPDSVTPLALVYVGYPAEQKEPRTQFREERVHWDMYKGE
jgi:nitroreductase